MGHLVKKEEMELGGYLEGVGECWIDLLVLGKKGMDAEVVRLS